MRMIEQLVAAGALLVATHSVAHEGHGLTGSHWHATDAWGFAVVAGLAAFAIWLSRRK